MIGDCDEGGRRKDAFDVLSFLFLCASVAQIYLI
jgi:hypothetical protein